MEKLAKVAAIIFITAGVTFIATTISACVANELEADCINVAADRKRGVKC